MAEPLVGIVMGSDSDLPKLQKTIDTLREFDIPFSVDVISAHRTPGRAHDFATNAADRGLRVLIAAAGGAAHLAGVMASLTTLPVIGVPIPTSNLGGLDSLLSTVQMPGGVAVATVGIGSGGAKNAALIAVQILATANPTLAEKLRQHKATMAEEVAAKSERVKAEIDG
jgi:phosphoribosylaminoimidazole carboxylase PurE protein